LSVFVLAIGILTGCAMTPAMPLTPAEQVEAEAIRKVLADHMAALSARNLDRGADAVADDARMDSRVAGGKVSKAQWRGAVQRSIAGGQWPATLDYQVSSVAFPDPAHATVFGHLVAIQVTGRRTQDRLELKLAKRDGRWLIVESRYL
jgi:uncharacterized protein (TIGR02246 family)